MVLGFFSSESIKNNVFYIRLDCIQIPILVLDFHVQKTDWKLQFSISFAWHAQKSWKELKYLGNISTDHTKYLQM